LEAQEAAGRAEREAQEAAAKEEIARIAKEEAGKQARGGKLEILDRAWLEEVETIRELEEQVQKRKRMLQDYMQGLPASRRC